MICGNCGKVVKTLLCKVFLMFYFVRSYLLRKEIEWKKTWKIKRLIAFEMCFIQVTFFEYVSRLIMEKF